MKTSIAKILLALSSLTLCAGCNFLQVDHPTVGYTNPDRLSAVEKAWMARHEYDAKTGLLHPYYRGMRYGATRSYNQGEKTISSKEWWMKDRKINDLADQPLRVASRRQPTFRPVPASIVKPSAPTLSGARPVQPTAVAGAAPAPTDPAGGLPDMPVFSTGEAVPDLPGGIPVDTVGIDSPFLPSAPTLPGEETAVPVAPIPGVALPGTPLPAGGGAFPAAPGGGAFPAAPPVGG